MNDNPCYLNISVEGIEAIEMNFFTLYLHLPIIPNTNLYITGYSDFLRLHFLPHHIPHDC